MLYRTNLVLEILDIWAREKARREIVRWCNENAGANNWRYYGEYTKTPFDICFRYEEDLLAFKLRYT